MPKAGKPPAAPRVPVDPLHDPDEQPFAAWEQGLTVRERRVRQVVDMMLRGVWVGGVSDEVLAKKWDCSPGNVRQISAEANRVLRARLREDPEAQKEARALLLAGFDAIRMRGMVNGDAASLRVALDAMRAQGFYLGIEPAKKLDVTGRHDPMEGWSLEEKLAYARDGRRPRRALERMNGNGDDKVH